MFYNLGRMSSTTTLLTDEEFLALPKTPGKQELIVEISSEANTDEQMERKRLEYLENGTGEVWIIYPVTETMMVCGRDFTRHIRASETY